MKNFKILALVLLLGFIGCDKEDENINTVYDSVNGRTGISFSRSTQPSFVVPTEGITQTIEVQSTTVSTSARTYNVAVDESSSVMPSDYSIGTIMIPANSYIGTLDVTFNYDNLEDFVTNTLVLNLALPEGITVLNGTTTFTYLKFFDVSTFVCNDLSVRIVTDAFGSETSWEIRSDAGALIASGGPYSDDTAGQTVGSDVTLETGCYTFTILDSFGDGLFDGNTTGTYNLFCSAVSAVSYASGSGNFGASESTDFCIN